MTTFTEKVSVLTTDKSLPETVMRNEENVPDSFVIPVRSMIHVSHGLAQQRGDLKSFHFTTTGIENVDNEEEKSEPYADEERYLPRETSLSNRR